MYLFCYALPCVHSCFAIILKRKNKLVALLLLSFDCIVTINVLWLFLTVPWVGLQCVIVIFPDHTHLLFVPERGTTDAIIVVWQILENCLAVNKHINMAYLALEKAFICVLRIFIWSELRKLCYPGSEHQCHVCVVYGYSQEFTMNFVVSHCSGAQSFALYHCAGGIVTCFTLWSSVGGYLCRSSCNLECYCITYFFSNINSNMGLK